jgi:class 3 adenylate cyclase/tetratricopeptide (TPR) repeat protein
MVTCATCGTENPSSSKFCSACGTALALTCTNCGNALLPGARFCSECGTAVPGAEAAFVGGATPAPGGPAGASRETATAPEAERRHVTVLFADLVGFTPFAEERDAEDVRDTLSRYFEIASDVIGRYGGTVEKFIGDAVMAVWGAPTAHEDDAERAVRAGLDLVDAVRALGASIQARVGVLSGEAAVTLGATNQGMVAGDLVNTAARLQSVAEPGTVLVGEATERAASRAIAFEPVGEQALKGKTAPVAAWKALRVVAERGGRNRSEALEAPFVGRDDELRLLKELFHSTGREGRARLVSVTGIGGIGKSRLAWEFLKYLDGLVENVWWHHGRSPAYGEGITFWALGEMVRGRAGLLEGDDDTTTRAKVTEMLATHVPDTDERSWIEPALLTLLGIESASVAREQLFAAWRAFFERLSATSTVIMVFEDLQWADAGLLDFIDSVLEWSRSHPIYVVTLARPELIERRNDWGAGKRNFSSLFLEPLPEQAMRELLAGLVPGLPDAAAGAIVARADGVPLYAVETVRMLLADGKLEARPDGTYAPVGELTQLAVPESLTALIASRLDGLDAADRVLLQDAAVLGQAFSPAALGAVSGTDEVALEPRLHSLVRGELLSLEADPRSPERGQYSFVQALIREVAYNTLARKDRKARHLAAARYYESLGNEEIAGALAGHYLAAHANATEGPEAEALAVQARLALRGAAERAASLGSHEQARAFLEQALSVTSDPLEEADLLERSGAAAAATNQLDAAERSYRAAIERWEAAGERASTARTTAALGSAFLTLYRMEAAIELLEPASVRYADLADDPAVVRLDGQLARAYFLHDEHQRAAEVADRVLAAAEQADLIDIVSDTLVTKGSALRYLRRYREGLGLIQIGKDLAERYGLLLIVQRALNNLASFSLDEDPRAALESAREGMALAKRLGIRPFQVLDNAVTAALEIGEWDWALGELEDRRFVETDPVARSVVVGDLQTILSFRGEPAADELAELESITEGEPDESMKATAIHWGRGVDAFATGRYAEARTWFHKVAVSYPAAVGDVYPLAARAALWAADAAGAASDLARIDQTDRRGRAFDNDKNVIRAGIAALGGRSDEALAAYRDALQTWRELGCVWDEALCAIDMALVLDPAQPEVRTAGAAAREILVRLKAKPFIQKLDEALAKAPTPGGLVREAPAPTAVETGARTG